MKSQKNKAFKKSKKLLKMWSFIFLCFLFAVNTYAWFIYISKVSSNLDAKVVEWDIIFADKEDNEIQNVSVTFADLYPGMIKVSNEYIIKNNSDLNAEFEYNLKSIKLFGELYEENVDYNGDTFEENFNTYFPFDIDITTNNNSINSKSQINLDISASWNFESEDEYFKINQFYKYKSNFDYYTLSNNIYNKVEVNESNYDSLVESGLYLLSDDADSYWGELSKSFSSLNPESTSIELNLELKVKQS